MPLKLRGDATGDTWRRSADCIGTQLAVHRHEEGDERGMRGGCTGFLTRMHEIRDKEARDSGQLLHFGDFFCIFALC